VVRLRPTVVEGLARHGLIQGPSDTPDSLRDRLNDAYLGEVRQLKQRQKAGEIPIRDYARHAQELKETYPLLGLPLSKWVE
jgi:hypothetical protein